MPGVAFHSFQDIAAPQSLQNFASVWWPWLPQAAQVRSDRAGPSRPAPWRRVISAVTIPDGTAWMPHPSSSRNYAIPLSRFVCGVMSP
jgi:hypothetical protein